MSEITSIPRRVLLLPPLVSEKIAAGEVIERPASVVKELVENSLDAGATEVAVILEQGGKGLIEVLDNGHGMAPDDVALALERHATSKIRELDDLDRIATMGFRGEALPSVAAVSELKLTSRSRDAGDSSTAYEVDASLRTGGTRKAQAVTFGHFLGSPHGTRVQARNLFSQVPARLKFLKSQGAEVAQVREWIERLALTHPAVGFRLVSDDRTVLNLRPQTEEQRVLAILGDGEAFPVITASSDLGIGLPAPFRVRAHWLQGLSSPQMRKLAQVVNRRAVRDRMLQQAILSPFRQALLPGQFPAVAVFLEIDPARLDVNVHPTKTEVRFLNSGEVFRAVQSLLEDMIGRHGASGYVAGRAETITTASSGWTARDSAAATGFSLESAPTSRGGASSGFQLSVPTAPLAQRQSDTGRGDQLALPRSSEASATPTAPTAHPFAEARFRGVVFNTYLMLESSADELVLVDQHAAHERIRYELLKTRVLQGEARSGAQALLIPEVVRLQDENRATIEARLSLLETLGFETELFGEDSLLFRSIPGDWGTADLRSRLANLVGRLGALEDSEIPAAGSERALLIDERLFEKLASEACHSSIRAGDALEAPEAQALIDQLFRCEHPWNCPHGRPTTVRVPRARFEEWFHRRVPG